LSRSWIKLVVSYLRHSTELASYHTVKHLFGWILCDLYTLPDYTVRSFGVYCPCDSRWRVGLKKPRISPEPPANEKADALPVVLRIGLAMIGNFTSEPLIAMYSRIKT